MAERVLSDRELNRALLARQLLRERRKLAVPAAVERIGALQAQWPPSPYVALWSRLQNFRRAQLARALEERRVVKATLMRSTLHIVSANDYAHFAPLLEEQWLANIKSRFSPQRAQRHLDGIAERVATIVKTPMTRGEIEEELGPWLRDAPSGTRWLLWAVVQARASLVHAPESGAWRTGGNSRYVSAYRWIDPRRDGSDGAALIVRRYLGAFGPASHRDVQSWTGLSGPRVRRGYEALEHELRTVRDEQNRELLDLVRAPLPAAEVPARARFLPKWDSSLLAYAPADRVRILPEEYRVGVIQKNGDVAQTILVDGFVAGTWVVERTKTKATLQIEPFTPLPRAARRELEEEGERLVRFVADDFASHAVRVA